MYDEECKSDDVFGKTERRLEAWRPIFLAPGECRRLVLAAAVEEPTW